MGEWTAPFAIVLAVDGFNYLIALIVTGIASAVALYSIRHTEVHSSLTKYYTLLTLFTLGMLGVTLTGDLFNLYVFFEIMAISAYSLVAFKSSDPESVEGSFKFLITGSIGTSLILLSIAFLYSFTGTLNMADMAVKLGTLNGIVPLIAFSMLVVGFGVKSVLVPMHAWKPDAITGAPSGVAALIAGVAPSIGLYGIFRVLYTILPAQQLFNTILLALAMLTMVVGGLMALFQDDIKRLLAYASISQAGYVAFGLSLAHLSQTAALGGMFHILNFALAEALLFLCVGAVIFRTGIKDMNLLGGLSRGMPITAFSFVMGSLAIAGIPPLNGFVSKWLLYVGGVEAGYPGLTIIAILFSVITLAYLLKAFYSIFFGPAIHKVKEAPPTMIIPIIILLLLCILFGVLPQLAMNAVEPAAAAIASKSAYIQAVLG
jgi:multicomponent Na+:H+ antiporter subunit D